MSRFSEMIDGSFDELMRLEDMLCRIPAPSWKEQKRAAFVRDYLSAYGETHIDDADNVVFTAFDDGSEGAVLICAHTDTVFPDEEPFVPVSDGDRFCCPGAGDDTMNLAAMMILIKYLAVSGARPLCPVIFAANTGEEGLGNLRGSRELVKTYGGRLKYFISLDGDYLNICNGAVGSHRYRVTAVTAGGHSFGNFGNRNAIEVLASLICDLYGVKVPEKAKTTYNVGVIEGGTSVNTIAQSASMLYEYRSEDAECLRYMKERFEDAVAKANAAVDANVTAEIVGVRPCSENVDSALLAELTAIADEAIHGVLPGIQCPVCASSTDCNIPLAAGIPAIATGLYLGSGAHTREEFILPASLHDGMKIGVRLLGNFFFCD